MTQLLMWPVDHDGNTYSPIRRTTALLGSVLSFDKKDVPLTELQANGLPPDRQSKHDITFRVGTHGEFILIIVCTKNFICGFRHSIKCCCFGIPMQCIYIHWNNSHHCSGINVKSTHIANTLIHSLLLIASFICLKKRLSLKAETNQQSCCFCSSWHSKLSALLNDPIVKPPLQCMCVSVVMKYGCQFVCQSSLLL